MVETTKQAQANLVSVDEGRPNIIDTAQTVIAEGTETPDQIAASIREELAAHLQLLGMGNNADVIDAGSDPKELVRVRHAAQRREFRAREMTFVDRYGRRLLTHFADGRDICPQAIDPIICPVTSSESEDGRLFRLATLLWSVPVSRGYGRRMRFLVRDRSNGKLIGLFALADPVFNLRARDAWIGWTADDRRKRLVNVMDAHVVGAVPPYNLLLGGKVVAALMTAREVSQVFAAKYGESCGIISHQRKSAHLTLITVTSALGRSSLYNRLRLPGTMEFTRIGMTEGWGHFHVPEHIFRRMRRLLEMNGRPYASAHHYGDGPNWRMRVVREALIQVGLDPQIMRHGITREIYVAPLAARWREILCGEEGGFAPQRPSAEEIARQAILRWVVPRAERRPDFHAWTADDTWRLIQGEFAQ